MRHRFYLRSGLTMVVGCLLAGCQIIDRPRAAPPRAEVNQFTDIPSYPIQRVVIVPFENRTPFANEPAAIQERLSARFRASGCFEPVDASPWYTMPCPMNAIANGEYPLEFLVDVQQRFHADCVLFGSVNEHSPYTPLSLGLTLHLVDTRDAKVIWSVDGHWSTSDPIVRDDFKHAVWHSGDPGQEVMTSSPLQFNDYVADLIVTALCGSRAERARPKPNVGMTPFRNLAPCLPAVPIRWFRRLRAISVGR